MAQRTLEGVSFLDAAKCTVEGIVKSRQGAEAGDRYFLVTDDAFSGWEHESIHFRETLAKLKPKATKGSVNTWVSQGFKLMNAFRHLTGTDTYGYGRSPPRAEPGLLLLFSDDSVEALDNKLWVPGENFNTEAWRYDQRFYVVQFTHRTPSTASSIARNTGGQLYSVNTFKGAQALVEVLGSAIKQPVFTVELLSDDGLQLPVSFILDKRQRSCSWPLPEELSEFGRDSYTRTSNPVLVYRSYDRLPSFNPPLDFPVDSYEGVINREIESTFTNRIDQQAWFPVCLRGHDRPFGVLHWTEKSLKLLVCCYNFIELWESLNFTPAPYNDAERMRLNEKRFNEVLRTLPVCYNHILPTVLKRMKIFFPASSKLGVIPALSPQMAQQVKLLYEQEFALRKEVDLQFKTLLELHAKRTASCCQVKQLSLATDAFSISRKNLKSAVFALTAQFFSLTTECPIGRMGDYQSAVDKHNDIRNPFTEIELERRPVNFGNPFRESVKKDQGFIELEADIHLPKFNQEVKPSVVKVPVKRPRGYKVQHEVAKFCKKQEHNILKVVAMLRERNPEADTQLISLLQGQLNKVYKNKNSQRIIRYHEGKVCLLEAVCALAKAHNKSHLVAQVQSLRSSL